jgi:hypothetical protein
MTTIRWEKWSAISQILGTAALVVTLVYLAVQTDQNTAAIQATVRQAMLSEDRESLYKLIEHPFLNDRCGLTDEQRIQMRAYLLAFLRMRENHWLQFQRGVLDEATWRSYQAALPGVVLSSEVGRAVWEQSESVFDQTFVASVNKLMSVTPIVACE